MCALVGCRRYSIFFWTLIPREVFTTSSSLLWNPRGRLIRVKQALAGTPTCSCIHRKKPITTHQSHRGKNCSVSVSLGLWSTILEVCFSQTHEFYKTFSFCVPLGVGTTVCVQSGTDGLPQAIYMYERIFFLLWNRHCIITMYDPLCLFTGKRCVFTGKRCIERCFYDMLHHPPSIHVFFFFFFPSTSLPLYLFIV